MQNGNHGSRTGAREARHTVQQHAQLEARLVPRDLAQARQERLVALELREVLDRPDERRAAHRGTPLRREVDEFFEDRGAERDAAAAGGEHDGGRVSVLGVHQAAVGTCVGVRRLSGGVCQRKRGRGGPTLDRTLDDARLVRVGSRASMRLELARPVAGGLGEQRQGVRATAERHIDESALSCRAGREDKKARTRAESIRWARWRS